MGSKRDEMEKSFVPKRLNFEDFEYLIGTPESMIDYLQNTHPETHSLRRLETMRNTKNTETQFAWNINPYKIGMCFIHRLLNTSYKDGMVNVRLERDLFRHVRITCNMVELENNWRQQRLKRKSMKLAGTLFVISDGLQQTKLYNTLIKKGASLLGHEHPDEPFTNRRRRGNSRLVAEKFVSFALNDSIDQWTTLIAEKNDLFTLKLRLGDSPIRSCTITTRLLDNLDFIVNCSDLLGTDRMNEYELNAKKRKEDKARDKAKKKPGPKTDEVEDDVDDNRWLKPGGRKVRKKRASELNVQKREEDMGEKKEEGPTVEEEKTGIWRTHRMCEMCILVVLGLQDYRMDNILYSLALYLNEHSDYNIYVVHIYYITTAHCKHDNFRYFTNFNNWHKLIAEHEVRETVQPSQPDWLEARAVVHNDVPWTFLLSPVLGNRSSTNYLLSEKEPLSGGNPFPEEEIHTRNQTPITPQRPPTPKLPRELVAAGDESLLKTSKNPLILNLFLKDDHLPGVRRRKEHFGSDVEVPLEAQKYLLILNRLQKDNLPMKIRRRREDLSLEAKALQQTHKTLLFLGYLLKNKYLPRIRLLRRFSVSEAKALPKTHMHLLILNRLLKDKLLSRIRRLRRYSGSETHMHLLIPNHLLKDKYLPIRALHKFHKTLSNLNKCNLNSTMQTEIRYLSIL